MIQIQIALIKLFLVFILIHFNWSDNKIKKPKRDIRDYTDADIERLYDEWEENDDEVLPNDEKPEHQRQKPNVDFGELRKNSNSPEDLMKLSKKGQPSMMFISVSDGNSEKATRRFTDRVSSLWQTYLYNNHIDVQTYTIEDNRLLFMFKDGSQAWESKEFLLKQPECNEIVLEGQTSYGFASKTKHEL